MLVLIGNIDEYDEVCTPSQSVEQVVRSPQPSTPDPSPLPRPDKRINYIVWLLAALVAIELFR